MEYIEFVKQVRDLDFIADETSADAAVKAVLGILASELREPQARILAEKLPAPLTFEKLRSHQRKTAIMISADDYIQEIADQFNLNREQAKQLVGKVLHLAKITVGSEGMDAVEKTLPDDWKKMIGSV